MLYITTIGVKASLFANPTTHVSPDPEAIGGIGERIIGSEIAPIARRTLLGPPQIPIGTCATQRYFLYSSSFSLLFALQCYASSFASLGRMGFTDYLCTHQTIGHTAFSSVTTQYGSFSTNRPYTQFLSINCCVPHGLIQLVFLSVLHVYYICNAPRGSPLFDRVN